LPCWSDGVVVECGFLRNVAFHELLIKASRSLTSG
jgi:hypothetical protein